MTPTNQSVFGDAQNFGRPPQPLAHRTGPCRPGEIPDQRGSGTVEFKHGPIRPCKSLRDCPKGLLGTPLGRTWAAYTVGHAYGALGRASHHRLRAAQPMFPNELSGNGPPQPCSFSDKYGPIRPNGASTKDFVESRRTAAGLRPPTVATERFHRSW